MNADDSYFADTLLKKVGELNEVLGRASSEGIDVDISIVNATSVGDKVRRIKLAITAERKTVKKIL